MAMSYTKVTAPMTEAVEQAGQIAHLQLQKALQVAQVAKQESPEIVAALLQAIVSNYAVAMKTGSAAAPAKTATVTAAKPALAAARKK